MPILSPAHAALRDALAAGLGTTALLYAMLVVLQSGDRPWKDGAVLWLHIFLVAVLPQIAAMALTLGGSATLGPALAAGAAGAMLVALGGYWIAVFRGGALNAFTAILFYNITLGAALFLFVPAQLIVARAAMRAIGGPAGANVAVVAVAWLAVAAWYATGGVMAAPLQRGAARTERRSHFSPEVAERHLVRVYRCLWRLAGPGAVNGFPASLDEIRSLGPECWDPKDAPDGESFGSYYDFVYRPGPPDADGRIRRFSVLTKARTARGRWTRSFHLDEGALLRKNERGWADRPDSRVESYAAFALPLLRWTLEEYRRRGAGDYPRRILDEAHAAAARADDLVLPLRVPHEWRGVVPLARDWDLVRELEDGASLLEWRRGSRGVFALYRPIAAPDGHVARYTLEMHADDRDATSPRGMGRLRSYFVDEAGRVHATGEPRPATAADPLVVEGELLLEILVHELAPKELHRWLTGAADGE